MSTFQELDLIAPIRRALADQQYKTPTPIQQKAIPAALEGRDVLGSAQTGTGKTAAFSLPILNRLGKTNRKARPKQPYALLLAPTRELAIQIADSLDDYGRHLHLRHALIFGGVNQNRQVQALRRGAHILVATPGRLLDLMNQGFIDLSMLDVFVLDEADRMLDMGFLPDLRRIIKCLPDKRQSLFFSATLPPKIVELSKKLLTKPVQVSIAPKEKNVDLINQQVVFVERPGKLGYVLELLASEEAERVIIFTRTKRGANAVAEKLDRRGIRTSAIHGNKSQNARQRALESFRNDKIRVLVATDVCARGIDVDGISHVINYDIPDDPESYIHRIGRTGRAGAEGIAISLCSKSERGELKSIERLIGKAVPPAANQPEPILDERPKPSPRRSGVRGGERNSSNSRRKKKPNSTGNRRKTTASKVRNDASESGGQSRRSIKPSKHTQRERTTGTTAKNKPTTVRGETRAPNDEVTSESNPPKKEKRRKKKRPGRNERQRLKQQSSEAT